MAVLIVDAQKFLNILGMAMVCLGKSADIAVHRESRLLIHFLRLLIHTPAGSVLIVHERVWFSFYFPRLLPNVARCWMFLDLAPSRL